MILPILRILKLESVGDRFFYILEAVRHYIRPHNIHIQEERCRMHKSQCWLRVAAAVFLFFGLSGVAQAATTY